MYKISNNDNMTTIVELILIVLYLFSMYGIVIYWTILKPCVNSYSENNKKIICENSGNIYELVEQIKNSDSEEDDENVFNKASPTSNNNSDDYSVISCTNSSSSELINQV